MLSLQLYLSHHSCSSLAFRATGTVNRDNKTIVSVVFITAEASQWSSDAQRFGGTKIFAVHYCIYFIPWATRAKQKRCSRSLRKRATGVSTTGVLGELHTLMGHTASSETIWILWSPFVSFIHVWIIAFQIPQAHNEHPALCFYAIHFFHNKKQSIEETGFHPSSIQYSRYIALTPKHAQSLAQQFICNSVVSLLLESGRRFWI